MNNVPDQVKTMMTHVNNFLSDPSKMISNMNEEFAAGIVFFIVLLLVLFMCINLYYNSTLEGRLCSYMDGIYSTINGKIRPVALNKSDPQLGYLLRDYYIKTAFNACNGGSYKNSVVSTCNLIDVIKQGVRGFDFEIYSLNDTPVVASSTQDSYFIKETYNSLDFGTVMSVLKNYAYTNSSCPNPNDPIILHLRIKSTNQKMYSALARILETYDTMMLGPNFSCENNGKYLGSVKLLDLIGKIIVIVEKGNTAFMQNTSFYEYVNMTSNSVFMRALKYYDAKFTPDMNELINFNKQNMTIVKCDSGSSPENPSAVLTRTMGCQMAAMRYQLNDAFLKEDNAFFDSYGYAFCLKPENLRHIPIVVADPPPPDKKLSYAPKQKVANYYNITF
jgi:hypothetical protein